MKYQIKSILRDRLFILFLIMLTFVYFILNIYLYTRSKPRQELMQDHAMALFEDINTNKIYWLRKGYIIDSSHDKKYYNNLKDAFFETERALSQIMDGENISNDKYLEMIMPYELLSRQMQSIDHKAYTSIGQLRPKRLEEFLEKNDYSYDFESLNFMNIDDMVWASFVDGLRLVESARYLDNYFEAKAEVFDNEYSKYNYIRKINYIGPQPSTYMIASLSKAIIPLVTYYLIYKMKKDGTIKNLYLRPKSRPRNYLYLLCICILAALLICLIPRLINIGLSHMTGENIPTNTDMVIYADNLISPETSFAGNENAVKTIGLSDIKVHLKRISVQDMDPNGDYKTYSDLDQIPFINFFTRAKLIDFLKIILICITSLSIGIFIKNRLVAGGLLILVSLSIFISGQDLILSKISIIKPWTNPFFMTSGWNISLGAERLSWYSAIHILLLWIGVFLGLSLFISKFSKLE